jgi:hypothetical protein
MNKSPLTSIMTGVLGLSALASLILCYLTITYTHQMRSLRLPLARATLLHNVSVSLAGDALEYSKTHPAIIPVLQASGVQVSPAPSSTKSTR